MADQPRPIAFGTPEGVSEGQWFKSHAALHAAHVHRASGGGISGSANTGADSIVLSGGYIDDDDQGDEIIYTGQGGRNRDTGRLVADQSMDHKGNAALLVSQAMGYPVRVVEGLGITGKKRRRATKGYVFRGLYRVVEHWTKFGQEGFRICQFRLLRLSEGEDVRPSPVVLAGDEDTDIERKLRRYIERERLIRDSRIVRQVKQLYDNACQICRTRLVVSPFGEACSEAAHIQALGGANPGPDVLENILCLCPNCHTLFDRGAFYITDNFEVINSLTREFIATLERVEGHQIGLRYVREHRAQWERRERPGTGMFPG